MVVVLGSDVRLERLCVGQAVACVVGKGGTGYRSGRYSGAVGQWDSAAGHWDSSTGGVFGSVVRGLWWEPRLMGDSQSNSI